jgi:hypothetical protein
MAGVGGACWPGGVLEGVVEELLGVLGDGEREGKLDATTNLPPTKPIHNSTLPPPEPVGICLEPLFHQDSSLGSGGRLLEQRFITITYASPP